MNQLILGDNLEIMRKMESETIDLIYLDPPFFSNRNYEVIWGDKGEIRSFEDRWSGGIDHYIAWLKERVAEMHRLLKPTGSIYLHCDWHANAYIRVYILDKIFGENNFRNEIIWVRTNSKGLSFTRFSQNHDMLFYYSKSNNLTWNPLYLAHDEKYINDFYKYFEENTGRKYQLADLTNPNKDRPNLTYEFLGIKRVWRWTKERMQEAYEKGLIVQAKKGSVPRLKRYLDEQEGNPIDDNWIDISINKLSSSERIGYPTQKPEALLERIILSSSNENDIVMDPFVGGGTTIVVADKLKRKWIGIDQSAQAIKVSEFRLNRNQSLFSEPFTLQLHKYDFDLLRTKDAFEFEKWIIEKFGGISNIKKKGDLGIDGKLKNIPIQVKRSDNIGRNIIDNFLSAIKRYDNNLFEKNKGAKKITGYIIAFSFGKGAIQEVARLQNEENILIELIRVDSIISIANKPTLKIEIIDNGTDEHGLRQIEFIATNGDNLAFYSWDFNYSTEKGSFKPEIIRDIEGHQTYKFKPGTHSIAIKAVDNEGMEAVEVVRVKVNGDVSEL